MLGTIVLLCALARSATNRPQEVFQGLIAWHKGQDASHSRWLVIQNLPHMRRRLGQQTLDANALACLPTTCTRGEH
eukprot:scaffold49878_cov40-Tisochrysis_lutea.AAC.5